MMSYPVSEVKNRLSELVGLAQTGMTIHITRRGKEVARIVPVPIQDQHYHQQDSQESP